MSSKRHRGRGFRITLHKGPTIIIAHSDTESTNCGFPTKHERAPARLFRGVSEALAVLHAVRLTTYISEAPYANANTALPCYICGMLGFLWMKYSTRFMRDAVRCTVRSLAAKYSVETSAGHTCWHKLYTTYKFYV